MKGFKTSLLLFLSSLQPDAAIGDAKPTVGTSDTPSDPVSLRPLNSPLDNKFAGHRSHSSHSSHRSHRSSSGGSYTPPPAETTPAPSASPPPAPSASPPPGARGLTGPPTEPPAAAATKAGSAAPTLSLQEKKKLQVMRVQIALSNLGLYTGQIDGVLNDPTQEALKRFQRLKSIDDDGLMSTDTLNALNVPAVQ
jgi:His-Xaa-Ser repeat protein HxsA